MSMAGHFTIASQTLAIGITPKVMHVRSYDFVIDATSGNSDDVQDNYEHWDVNLDVGIARQIDSQWRAGLVVKNLRTLKYKTSLGNTIELKPQVRAGVMLKSHMGLYALDADVIENNSVRSGYDTQMLSLGGEWSVHPAIKLRAGASKNLSGVDAGEKILYTLGVHGELLGGITDLIYARNSYERAVGFQIGVRF